MLNLSQLFKHKKNNDWEIGSVRVYEIKVNTVILKILISVQ